MSEQTFRINPRYRLQWEPAQNCHVLLYPEGLVQLSDSAYAILQRCTRDTTESELIAGLQAEYPAAESLPADVREFLQQAFEKEWLKALGPSA